MKDKYLYSTIFGFVSGVFVRSFVFVPFAYISLLVLTFFVIFCFLKLINNKNVSLNSFILVVFFVLGMFRFGVSEYDPSKDLLIEKINQQVSIEGIVADEPDVRENNTRLTISLQNTESLVLVTIPKYPEFQYGDMVHLSGKLSLPENFTTDSERIFDYVSYLAKDGIQYVMFMPEISFISLGHGNQIKSALFKLKSSFIDRVESVIPSPESSLLGGLVVGAKTSLGSELKDDFIKVGLIHIVVLSGYNITIVAEAIMKSFSFFPRPLGISFGVVSIIFFALMTGASATTVRASIMALLVILTKVTGRTYNITRALLIAGFFMVLQNPRILVFDLSFQLSFLATLALIYVSPLVEPKLGFVTEKFGLRSIVSATIATQIFVSPFILYSMGNFSVVALITNLLVLPFVPATMFFGFLSGIFAFAGHFVALPFAFIAKLLLSYELLVVKIFSHLPFASLNISYFPLGLMLAIYVFYVWCIWKHSKKPA